MSAGVALLAVVLAWRAGGGAVDLPWASTWGVRLTLTFDGLSADYGLLATGIGVAVLVYSSTYIPRHLAHLRRPAAEATTFYALILLFMGAMVGLVMAGDLLLLFLFWDLTAVVSYFLIGFDRDEPASRPAALMALLVTGGTAILMLAGIVALWAMMGTTSIASLIASAPAGWSLTVSVALIVVAALAKSAQAPLHFWLPRAMVAPTPVSSYLHSAAMVAAGVFLLARLLPLVHRAAGVPDTLVILGLVSSGFGGVMALSRDDMKRLLAYSTIGQYGYVVTMLGLGGAYGAVGAGLYVLAHGLAKCALFLTAGAVTEATGHRRLSELGGLLRSLPGLAVASGIAAATLAALPLTIGYFKDELYFAAMHERGQALTLLAVVVAGLTFAYVARFWMGVFLGPRRAAAQPAPVAMFAPIAFLAALCLAGGVWIGPANDLANAAGEASLQMPVTIHLAYHLEASPENVMALIAYALGLAIVVSRAWWASLSLSLAALGERLGPDRLYRRTLNWLNAFSDRFHSYEIHDLRGRIAWILFPVGIFVLGGLVGTPNAGAFTISPVAPNDLLVILLVGVTALAAMAATTVTGHLAVALVLSAVGFPLAAVFAFLGAPDVALVAVLMETMLSLLFIGFLAAMRDRPQVEGIERDPAPSHRWRDWIVALVTTATSFVVVWSILSKPAALESDAQDQIALTPAAHARDIVTAILSDFRGFDTMGEITVIGIAMVGLLTLMQRPRQRRRHR